MLQQYKIKKDKFYSEELVNAPFASGYAYFSIS